MMDTPQLSIIVPFYNAAQYLHRSLNSIAKQTFKNFEVILVNDGSTDTSLEIASVYLQSPSFKLININRGGVSKARNAGLKQAKGEWIAFMDADDYIEPTFYKAYFNAISQLQCTCDIIFTGYIRELPSGNYRKLSLNFLHVNKDNLSIAIEYLNKAEALGWAWNKLFKRSLIEQYQIRFNPTIQLREDELFTLNYCQHINSILVIPTCLYHYMMNSGSLVHKKRDYIDYQRVSDLLYTEYSRYFDNERFRESYQIMHAQGIFYSLTTIYTRETEATKEQRLALVKKFIAFRAQLKYPDKIRYKANKYKNMLFKAMLNSDNVYVIDLILKLLIPCF